MVPSTLDGWTYEIVLELCAVGRSESDRHDFKFNLAELINSTKICCAFANSFGGFVVMGVKESGHLFEPLGIDPDKELYGKFLAKVKADPEITISQPKHLSVPGSKKLLYIFEVPCSARRPHLPSPVDQRVFWKRQGSTCAQMTLEEIRYQMNGYEEKREKLALLLIDLHHKLRSLNSQAQLSDGTYNGDIFAFENVDRIVVEAYSFLKQDITIIQKLDTIRQRLMLLNAVKQKMLAMLALSYSNEDKVSEMNRCRERARAILPEVTVLTEQIERSFQERFEISNPYKN